MKDNLYRFFKVATGAAILLCTISYRTAGQLLEMPNLELITEKEGLPFNSITDLLQDSKGFIWVSGPNGLARYDGYSFLTVPGEKKESSATGSIILSLTKTADGMIWAGSFNGRVTRINPETLETTHFNLNEKPAPAFNNIVFGDSQGNLWGFTESIGVFKFDGGSRFTFVDSLSNLPRHGLVPASTYNRVASFYEETPGLFWLATSNGLYRLEPDKKKIEHISSMSDDPNQPAFLHRIVADGRGGLWCSTWGSGLMHINVKTREFQKYLFEPGFGGTSNIIHGLARKSDHELWISSRGLGVFDEFTKTFSFYYDRQDFTSGLASLGIVRGKTGIIWVVTDKGIQKWAPNQNKFNYYKLKVTHSDNHSYYGVSHVLMDSATGRKIIGTTYADGLHILNGDGTETILPVALHPKAEPYQLVNDIIKDRDGRILVVTRDQLYELTSNNQLVRVNGPNALLNRGTIPYLYKIIQSLNGDYWLSSTRNGLFHFSKKQNAWTQITASVPNTLAFNRVMRILEDRDQKIWAAHSIHGISIYDPANDTWDHLNHIEGDSTSLVSNVFTDMTQTPSGKIVFATLEGISVIDARKKSIRNYTDKTGLSNHVIYSVAVDQQENLWIINNLGLVVFNENRGEIKKFTANDGLKGIYSSFSLKKSGNQIYVTTHQGFYVFDPAQALSNEEVPVPLFITSLQTQDSRVKGFNTPASINLSHTTNALSIEFAALNFFGARNNQYQYRMEGLDKAWRETFTNQVNYSSIPSGDYTFRVKLANGRAPEASVLVSVSTPFWKKLWFRLVMVGIGLGGVYVIYRLRLTQIRQEEKLKTEFNQKLADVEMKALKAQMSPHFIFNSLNSINRYIVKSEPETASLYLTKFSRLIRLILDNSNNKIISLEQELTALRLYIELEALRFNNKFTYTLHLDESLNPNSIGVPPMIIQPFIENAIWHGLLHKETPGQLDIAITRFGSGLQCIITDNGVGRKKAADMKSKSVNKDKSYGMKITKDRLNMLNGESKVSSVEIIDLEDEAGNPLGTKVIVKIMSAELEPEF